MNEVAKDPSDLAGPVATDEPVARLHAELAALKGALIALEARRRELARLLVHDLRNPLAAIIGYVDLLRAEIGDAPDALAIVDELAAVADKAIGMVGTLLDVEELEEGVLRAEPRAIRIDEFLTARVRQHRNAAAARNLRLGLEAPALDVAFDPDLIGRVVDNLLDNAVRYAERRGVVDVRAEVVAEVLEIRIGNDGPPVPLEDRARVFERYFRLAARRAAARESRGLGLYFCKLAVSAHGGTIEIVGTERLPCVFVVRLPQPVSRG
jgi:signal transduction histidine kinase